MTNNSKINGYKGILFMLLASLFFAINDALVKYVVKQLGSDYSLFNVVFVRAIFTSILILLSIFLFRKFDFKKLFNDKRSYTRGFFETAAAFTFLTGLMLMPMADTYTLLNIMPLLVTASPLMPNEISQHNREEIIKLGFDHVMVRTNQKVSRHLAKRFFIERGNPKIHWEATKEAVPLNIAIKYQIPLICKSCMKKVE